MIMELMPIIIGIVAIIALSVLIYRRVQDTITTLARCSALFTVHEFDEDTFESVVKVVIRTIIDCLFFGVCIGVIVQSVTVGVVKWLSLIF